MGKEKKDRVETTPERHAKKKHRKGGGQWGFVSGAFLFFPWPRFFKDRLSGVIRANRFARFARIGWFARIGNSSDSGESAWYAINIGVSIANDSRESRCESPVPLRGEINPRTRKSKIGTSTPPNPPSKEEFYGHGGFPAERTKNSQAPIKLARPFPPQNCGYGHSNSLQW